MTNSKGFFELKAENKEQLIAAIQELNFASDIRVDGDLVVVSVENEISATTLNKKLAEKGIYLSQLLLKKQSLESQFLQLVKNQN